MKIVFLDLDGPIYVSGSPIENAVYCLSELIRLTGAKIIITSRPGKTLNQITTQLSLCHGFPVDSVISAINTTNEITRGVDIELYIREHEDIENYVILDDKPYVLLSQAPHFVQTGDKGMTGGDFREALRVLG